MTHELGINLNDRNVLAAAFRHAIREVADTHRLEHRLIQDGCEGCQYVLAASTIQVTPEQDAADFPEPSDVR